MRPLRARNGNNQILVYWKGSEVDRSYPAPKCIRSVLAIQFSILVLQSNYSYVAMVMHLFGLWERGLVTIFCVCV